MEDYLANVKERAWIIAKVGTQRKLFIVVSLDERPVIYAPVENVRYII